MNTMNMMQPPRPRLAAIALLSMAVMASINLGIFDDLFSGHSSLSLGHLSSSIIVDDEETKDAIEDAEQFYRRYLLSFTDDEDDREEEDFSSYDAHAALAAGVDESQAELSTDTDSSSEPLPKYTLEDTLYESSIFEYTFGLLVYDPPNDIFQVYYNKNHQWKNGNRKLWSSLRKFTFMLRKLFPDRFTPNSPELIIPVGSGDYPHVKTNKLPNENGVAPVLMFGSVFRDSTIYPNMIGMPMPEKHHLDCFLEYMDNDGSMVCDLLKSGKANTASVNPKGLVFGDELGEEGEWDNLKPQVVWRGTDFGYLPTLSRTRHGPRFVKPDDGKFIRGDTSDKSGETERRMDAINALNEQIDTLLPRWKGVALTALSELEAEEPTVDDLPWANIKFSAYLGQGVNGSCKGKCPTIGSETYSQWESVGIATGEGMPLTELAKFKYHIDLGGGGGTTWSGTIEKLAMPGLLFHHNTPTKDYIHDHVKPWRHYIPVKSNLADLKQKFDWAEAHPQEAKRIADAGTEFMKKLGTVEGFGEIFESDFVEPIRRVIEAYQPIASEHPESSWRDVMESKGISQMPIMECTGTMYNYASCYLTIDDSEIGANWG